jgi:hypothetical protein
MMDNILFRLEDTITVKALHCLVGGVNHGSGMELLGWCGVLLLGEYFVGWRLKRKCLDGRMDGRDNNPHGILAQRFFRQVTNQTTFILENAFTTKEFHGKVGWCRMQ